MASDADPSVRLAVAVAARELVSDSLTVDTGSSQAEVGGILTTLIKSSADGKDPFLPFMIWMAGEPALARNPRGGLDWLAENGTITMPLSGILTRKAMRRICDTQETAKLDLAVNFLERIADSNSPLVLGALEGLIEGQKAKSLVPGVDTKLLFAKLSTSSDNQVKIRAQELGTLWGNAVSIRATLTAINNSKLSVDERAAAIEGVKNLKNDAVREALLQVVSNKNPESLMLDALHALGRVGDDKLGDELLNQWNSLTPSLRSAAADVMITKSRWAVALLTALEEKRVSPSELSMPTIRAFAESKNDFVRQRAAAVIGRIRPADVDKQKLIAQKKQMILNGPAPDLQAGHELAKKTCLICHKLSGEGADVGPDLTGAGRSTLDALLQNVIDPNQVIGKGYENVEVETKDGRNLSGRMVENTDTRVKLLSAGPKEEVIAKSDIASMRVSQLSVMPEGLEQMTDADFRNLILYVLNAPTGTSKGNP